MKKTFSRWKNLVYLEKIWNNLLYIYVWKYFICNTWKKNKRMNVALQRMEWWLNNSISTNVATGSTFRALTDSRCLFLNYCELCFLHIMKTHASCEGKLIAIIVESASDWSSCTASMASLVIPHVGPALD